MKDWKCTYVNPTDKSKTPCGAIVPSKTQPKSACPSCGRKNKWEEVVVAVVAVVSVGPTAWPIPLSARLQTALAGQYVTTDTNAAGDAPDGVANTTYGAGKHWGAGPNKWEAGQYDLPNIGPEQVAGLEVKACRLGLETVGGWVFTFGF